MSMYYCDNCEEVHDNDWTPCMPVNQGDTTVSLVCEDSHLEMYPRMRTIVGALVPGADIPGLQR